MPEPRDLRSQNGVLRVELAVHGYRDQDGRTRYCYVLPDGSQSPTLRLNPGDLLILKLKNDLVAAEHGLSEPNHVHRGVNSAKTPDPCESA